jgi:hypothetical protein
MTRPYLAKDAENLPLPVVGVHQSRYSWVSLGNDPLLILARMEGDIARYCGPDADRSPFFMGSDYSGRTVPGLGHGFQRADG